MLCLPDVPAPPGGDILCMVGRQIRVIVCTCVLEYMLLLSCIVLQYRGSIGVMAVAVQETYPMAVLSVYWVFLGGLVGWIWLWCCVLVFCLS